LVAEEQDLQVLHLQAEELQMQEMVLQILAEAEEQQL
jgi:hypothetical protein